MVLLHAPPPIGGTLSGPSEKVRSALPTEVALAAFLLSLGFCQETEMSPIPLIGVFSRLEDPRSGPAQRHDLREMIVVALCAILCGAESWVDVAEWGEDNESWLRKYLELAHGTASHDTFSRVFRLLDAKVFEACFREWVRSRM
jgi:hypothetical protein